MRKLTVHRLPTATAHRLLTQLQNELLLPLRLLALSTPISATTTTLLYIPLIHDQQGLLPLKAFFCELHFSEVKWQLIRLRNKLSNFGSWTALKADADCPFFVSQMSTKNR
jgi:hypothetical protein